MPSLSRQTLMRYSWGKKVGRTSPFAMDVQEAGEWALATCTVPGNLAIIGVSEGGVKKQLPAGAWWHTAAGRRSRSCFVMSLGRAAAPGTPVRGVRSYCDPVHELDTA